MSMYITSQAGVMIVGKLSVYMNQQIKEMQEANGFDLFDRDAVLYSLIEYAKHPRNFTKQDRIQYLLGKCCEFANLNVNKYLIEYHDYMDHYRIILS